MSYPSSPCRKLLLKIFLMKKQLLHYTSPTQPPLLPYSSRTHVVVVKTWNLPEPLSWGRSWSNLHSFMVLNILHYNIAAENVVKSLFQVMCSWSNLHFFMVLNILHYKIAAEDVVEPLFQVMCSLYWGTSKWVLDSINLMVSKVRILLNYFISPLLSTTYCEHKHIFLNSPN